MPYPVQNLIEGHGEPVCVHPQDSVQTALKLMTEHDFSQLPVVSEDKKPLGLVTHESILRALGNFGVKVENMLVSNAMVKVQKYRPEDDLFDLLDRLKDTNAALIVDGDDKLIGIVTTYNSTEYFRRRAEDMMLVEDIETMVKELVLAFFSDETGEVDQEKLAAAIDEITSSKHMLMGRYKNALRHYLKFQGQEKVAIDSQWLEDSFSHLAPKEKPKEFDDLTLYEYTEMMLHKSRWGFYQPFFRLESEALCKLLNEVRETRNALVHFKGEISPAQRDQLKFCAEWLAQHQVGIPVSWPVLVTEASPGQHAIREAVSPYETRDESGDSIVPAEEILGPGDSRYAPLAIWLQSQPSNINRIQRTFQEIEKIIGDVLPASARQHRAWWANDPTGHAQSQQWLDVGWRVSYINMAEETVTFARIKEREKSYIDFFSALLSELKIASFPLKKFSPDGQSWLTVAALPEIGPKCLYLSFSFARNKRFRVELYLDTGHEGKNKHIFNTLHDHKNQIETNLGDALSWEYLEDRRASRVALYHEGTITDNETELAELRRWAVDAMVRFRNAISAPVEQALKIVEQ